MYRQHKSLSKPYSKYLETSLRCGFASLLILLSPAHVNASNLYVALDSYEYDFSFGDINLGLDPVGIAIGGSLDLNDKLFVQYEFGEWDDDGGEISPRIESSYFDSSLLSAGVGIKLADWELLASYTDINDEARLQHGREQELNTNSEVSSHTIKFSVIRRQKVGSWERYYSFGLQYDDAKSMTIFDGSNQMLLQNSDALFGMLKFGGDYYIPAEGQSGWLLGASLRWYQELSSSADARQFNISDSGALLPLPSPGGSGNAGGNAVGGASINRTFGDNFGLLGLYATYQINDTWSLDWSASLGLAGDENSNSYALTLGLMF